MSLRLVCILKLEGLLQGYVKDACREILAYLDLKLNVQITLKYYTTISWNYIGIRNFQKSILYSMQEAF